MKATAGPRWRIAGFAVFAALALAVAGLLLASREPSRTVMAPGEADPDEPLAGGERMSITEAVEAFPLPLYRPDIALGSDATLTGVWVRTVDPPEAYLSYASGLVVLVRSAADLQPTREFADAQIRDRVRAR